MPSIHSEGERLSRTRESRGQKDVLQATLEKTHLKKRWDMESASDLQRGQRRSKGKRLRK
jgi:hypothetical protein